LGEQGKLFGPFNGFRAEKIARYGRREVRRGFKFVGSTICYALMQATGMVNDHLVTCPRYAALGGARQRK
jgi:hypothetical protein